MPHHFLIAVVYTSLEMEVWVIRFATESGSESELTPVEENSLTSILIHLAGKEYMVSVIR